MNDEDCCLSWRGVSATEVTEFLFLVEHEVPSKNVSIWRRAKRPDDPWGQSLVERLAMEVASDNVGRMKRPVI